MFKDYSDQKQQKNASKTYNIVDIDQAKQKLTQGYFLESQKQFDQHFILTIFSLAQHDKQVKDLLIKNIERVLYSKQIIVIQFFNFILHHREYSGMAQAFLLQLISLEIEINNSQFLRHIIQQLPNIFVILTISNHEIYESIITFLAFQMRSFDFKIRLQSIDTFSKLHDKLSTGQDKNRKLQTVFRTFLQTMIEKQILAKSVSYTRGIFLQMLQDQFHQIRVKSLQTLLIFKDYFKEEDLKQILIYMLNDEHQLVRQESLKSLKVLSRIHFNRQDLQTLLMCLRQKRTIMRRQTYQILAIASFDDIQLLTILVDKIIIALLNYKSDKKAIYRALFAIGNKHKSWISGLQGQLGLNQKQEPNFKNIVYKAKMILSYGWWKDRSRQENHILPQYFVSHMLYICDVQSYLFESSNKDKIQQETESSVDYKSLQSDKDKMVRFIQCQSQISEEFHKDLLNILKKYLIGHQRISLRKQLQRAMTIYKLEKEELELMARIKSILAKQQPIDRFIVLQLVKEVVSNRQKYQLKDMSIPRNKCTVSRLQPNLLISNKQKIFIDNIYLKCLKHKILNPERKPFYISLKQSQRVNENKDSYSWRINLSKYSEIQIILKLQKQEIILDDFIIDQK